MVVELESDRYAQKVRTLLLLQLPRHLLQATRLASSDRAERGVYLGEPPTYQYTVLQLEI